MLSKCANPSCSATFRYLGEGRIFTLVPGSESPLLHGVWDHASESIVERYWLCNVCAQTMTVCRLNDRVVVKRLPGRASPAETENSVIA